MIKEAVNIKSLEYLTPDVLRIVTEKPDDASFIPGQATEIFIDKIGWRMEGRPFTFTGLPTDDYLEFSIKTYPERKSVTNELRSLKPGDTLFVNDIFGAIEYKGEGTFIAGGAGVTPFISIFRNLKSKNEIGGNRLIFANKTREDIILREEFETMLGNNFINILSREKNDGYAFGRIDEDFLRRSGAAFDSYFYVCGPPAMMETVEEQLNHLNVPKERIVTEEF